MVDIAKCLDNKCPSRTKCYRYRAIGNEHRQSFAGFEHSPRTGICEFFWDSTGYHKTQLLSVADADRIIKRMKS